jgi:hypothetical protein
MSKPSQSRKDAFPSKLYRKRRLGRSDKYKRKKERKKDHLFSQQSKNIHYFTLLLDYTNGDRRTIKKL